MTFGLADYWRMLKARGPRLPIAYFLEAHLFDLRHGVDTHRWLPKDEFEETPENFEHGVLYMVSWTSAVRRAFRFVRARLGARFEGYAFLDIGCGKGKVVLAWTRECRRAGLSQAIHGLDYYAPFVELARANHRRMFGSEGSFVCGDATKLQPGRFGKKLIVYLYNPFDRPILEAVLDRLAGTDTIVVYNNPLHADALTAKGWALVHETRGFHPNTWTMIFERPAA